MSRAIYRRREGGLIKVKTAIIRRYAQSHKADNHPTGGSVDPPYITAAEGRGYSKSFSV